MYSTVGDEVIHLDGLPHSEIFGSKLDCSSPKRIAAYRVLHQLFAPRHPPRALCSLKPNNSTLKNVALLAKRVKQKNGVQALRSPTQHILKLNKELEVQAPPTLHQHNLTKLSYIRTAPHPCVAPYPKLYAMQL